MTEVDTNGQGPQDDSTDSADAGQTDADETPQGEHDPDDDHGSSGERKQRKRAQKAEREREQARELLDRTRQAIIDAALTAADMDPRLFALAEHNVDELLGDDGLIDADKLADAVADTAKQFPIARRGLEPNPQQGTNGGRPHTRPRPGLEPSRAARLPSAVVSARDGAATTRTVRLRGGTWTTARLRSTR